MNYKRSKYFTTSNKKKIKYFFLNKNSEITVVFFHGFMSDMTGKNPPAILKFCKKNKIGFIKYSILIFHPVTTEYNQLSKQIRILIKALKLSVRNYIVISPNNDKGSKFIFNEYRKLNKNKNFLIFPSMRFEFFLTLLKKYFQYQKY